ncbi:glycosyltransferase [Flavobacterium sp.]|uniref:glycosyltransferase n=1 Tax=Flavobacterium sp. TaxID=239 RepID=UPI0035283307
MVLEILLYALGVVTLIQFVYYIVIFGKFSFLKARNGTPKKVSVSVIVCAKNEAKNVKQFVPLLLQQNYPNFELVLIDDASTDETLDIFEEFEKQDSRVKLVKVANNEAFWGNKKYALTLGIKAAKNDYLLLTDGDCFPNSKNWISEMTAHFTEKKTIVLGYGAYTKVKNSFLNKIIRFETLLTATQYFAWAKNGKPYMGIGRNLAYKTTEFYNVRGFIDHMKIRSGDDDLFINQAATAKNTTICFSEDSFTYSEPKHTFKEWITQKRRHITTAKHYKTFDKFQLGLFYFSQLSFLILAIILLAFQHKWIIVLTLVAVRYLFTWISLGMASEKLKEKDVMYWFPIIEIIVIFTQLSLFITNIFSKPNHWK